MVERIEDRRGIPELRTDVPQALAPPKLVIYVSDLKRYLCLQVGFMTG